MRSKTKSTGVTDRWSHKHRKAKKMQQTQAAPTPIPSSTTQTLLTHCSLLRHSSHMKYLVAHRCQSVGNQKLDLCNLCSHVTAYDLGRDTSTIPSRQKRAQLGVHLNRRQPTKEDYRNFALYQANQKTYEADVLKKFVTHALHPDRIAECLEASPGSDSEGIVPYLRSVLQNVRGLAEKMIWNAQSRAVNLLANDGTDGIPFLDLQQVGGGIFSDFRHDNMIHVVGRMNESWHRAYTKPSMIRQSTKQYPIGCHSSPLEEIDETANQVFNNQDFIRKLATGRAVDISSKKKGRGRGLRGLAPREHVTPSTRGSWLSFPVTETSHPLAVQEQEPDPSDFQIAGPSRHQQENDHEEDSSFEPRFLDDLREIQRSEEIGHSHLEAPFIGSNGAELPSTRLEELVCLYGTEALDSDRATDEASEEVVDIAAEVPSWRSILLNDHKRRLTERFPPQTLRRALPGIKQVIANAVAMGYRCTNSDPEQDLQRKIAIIEAKEQSQLSHRPSIIKYAQSVQYTTEETPSLKTARPQPTATQNVRAKVPPVDATRKRQKTVKRPPATKKKVTSPKKKKEITTSTSAPNSRPAQAQRYAETESTGLPARHPSGSYTLEAHQVLPPDAYFEPQSQDEKPAWRCGIRHAMGYYYNAGNRSSCLGCNSNIKDMKRKIMDFYLPLSSCSYQEAPPNVIWKPYKPHGKPRTTKSHIHNSIAKDAYWPVYNETGDEQLAWRAGIDAVNDFLESRKPKEPTPEPTPEPEPDLGPHPSGSTTMEHGQDIPECAYFDRQDEDDEYAYRCDISHALGRYYLAGDKRSCPGCGTNKGGSGKQTIMDFFIPSGVYVRQEAPGLVQWKPRKPYNVKSREGAVKKKQYLLHNQSCSRKYFAAIDAGHDAEEAMRIAIAEFEAELDAKEADVQEEDDETSTTSSGSTDTSSPKDSVTTSHTSRASTSKRRRSPRQAHTPSPLVPAKRYLEVSSDEEEDGGGYDYAEEDEQEEGSIPEIIEVPSSSDDDEDTSGSDSE